VPAEEPSPALAHRSDYRLVRTLLLLQNEAATGTLRVEAEGVLTVIRLVRGRPAFVEGGLPSDSVGRLLVSRGQISEAQLAQIEEQRMVMQGRFKFGEVARRMGVIAPEALEAALRDQVREKLVRCLHWERSQHSYVAEEHGYDVNEGGLFEVEPLLLAGIARYYGRERMEEVLAPTWHEPVEFYGPDAELVERFGLGQDDEERLELMRSAPSVGAALARTGALDLRTGHLLVALALTDQLRMPDLEVPEESGPFVIDELTREPGRSRSKSPTESTPVARIEVLRKSQAPISDNLPGKDKLLADSAFLQGKELLRAREYGAAADAFREASNLRPGALEYALFAAWSAYLSTGRAPKWREMLVELSEKTLSQDRTLSFAHHVKGQLALEVSDHDAAKASLSRALELDPSDDEARELLQKMMS
jgi:tetratricopeptide (TPR) repeat protein